MINFSVYGTPQALKRHRSVKCGNFVRQYDPSAADKQDFLAKCIEHKPDKPFDEPLKMVLSFGFARPKSHYRTGKNAGILKDDAPSWHTQKPDADNLVKFVCDALNGIYWRDDSIVCCLTVIKYYTDAPNTEITISECEDFE